MVAYGGIEAEATGKRALKLKTCETMQHSSSSTDRANDMRNSDAARANAIRRLARLRMKRKLLLLAENQDTNNATSIMVSARRPRTYKVPIPPNPPPREVIASRMQLLFEKRLKYSDVKEEGRIVIPKAYAEKYMPTLESKEGVYIFMDDMVGVRKWIFRYRYWPNNSSRVYVLENTGELINAYGLQVGDFILVYKDKERQSFAVGTRKSDVDKEEEDDDDDALSSPMNAADANKDENLLVPKSDESWGSTSCPPKCASSLKSEYDGGLKGFPFQLLKVDIFDLPEY